MKNPSSPSPSPRKRINFLLLLPPVKPSVESTKGYFYISIKTDILTNRQNKNHVKYESKTKLLAAEWTLAEYHAEAEYQLSSPVPAHISGFQLDEIRSLLTSTAQKYCAAIHFQKFILLAHSLFMIGNNTYACTSKGSIDGDSYVKFENAKFHFPMIGLEDCAFFSSTEANGRKLPTTSDLIASEDVSSFASLSLNEVTVQEAIKAARLPTILLLSGEVYHGLVTLVCESDWKYGFSYSVLDMLNHVKSVAKGEDCSEQYDPLVYFLLATHQGLNSAISWLGEASASASNLVSKKFAVHKKAFLHYQMEELSTDVEVTPPSDQKERVMGHAGSPFESPFNSPFNSPFADEANMSTVESTTNQAQGPRVCFSPETDKEVSEFVESRISTSASSSQPLEPQQPEPPPTMLNMDAATSNTEAQRILWQSMLNLAHNQNENQKRNIDFNERNFEGLQRNDQRRITKKSMLGGQTVAQHSLLHLSLTPLEALRARPQFKFIDLNFLQDMKTLVESKSLVNVLNQIRELTRDYACTPNKPGWF